MVIQAGAIEKNGVIHIPSHWHFILKAYGELLPGTILVCRKESRLTDKATLPVPDGLEPVLLDKFDADGAMSRLYAYFQARPKLKEIVAQAKFVGAVLPSYLGHIAANFAIKMKKPLFVEIAGENTIYDRRLSLKLPFRYLAHSRTLNIDAQVLKKADLVVYVSQYLADTAVILPRIYGVVPHTTIYNRDIFRRDDTCQDKVIKIFSANRIVQEKGLQNLLVAVRKLRDDGFNITAMLAGDGDYLNTLKQQCSDLDLDEQVSFPGHINAGDNLWRLYRQADIMVLPTLASGEGTPKCILEAFASCCPVIASATGGIKTLLDNGHRGILVELGSIEELVAAIKTMITDDEARRKYIKTSYEWVSNATLEKRTEMLKDLLNRHLPAGTTK